MEPERPTKWNSRISAQSKKSQKSSCRSLDRGSWAERGHSLNRHYNMIEYLDKPFRVMSLESSKKSDIYEKMLVEDAPPPFLLTLGYPPREEENNFNPFKTTFKYTPEPINNRMSYEQKEDIEHTCTCYISCNEENCPCFRFKEEPCQEGYCCSECINAKLRKTVRSYLHGSDPKIFCTCKKTKCNKKYCTCFAAGVQCNENCSC